MDQTRGVKTAFQKFLTEYHILFDDSVLNKIFQKPLPDGKYALFLHPGEVALGPKYEARLFSTTKSSAPSLQCQSTGTFVTFNKGLAPPIPGIFPNYISYPFTYNNIIKIDVWMDVDNLIKTNPLSYIRCKWVPSADISFSGNTPIPSVIDVSNGSCQMTPGGTINGFKPPKTWDASTHCESLNETGWYNTSKSPNICPSSCQGACVKVLPKTLTHDQPGYVDGCNYIGGHLNLIQNTTKYETVGATGYKTIYTDLQNACNNSVMPHSSGKTYPNYIYDGNYCTYLQKYGKLHSQAGGVWTQTTGAFSCASISGDCSYNNINGCDNQGKASPPNPNALAGPTGPCIPQWMGVNTTYSWWWGGGQRNFTELPFPFYYFNAFNDRYGEGTDPEACGEWKGWDSSYCKLRWQSLYGPKGNAGDEITCKAVHNMYDLLGNKVDPKDPIAKMKGVCEANKITKNSLDNLPVTGLFPVSGDDYNSPNITVSGDGTYYPKAQDNIPAMNPSSIDSNQKVTNMMIPGASGGLDYTLLSKGKRIINDGSGQQYLSPEMLIYDTSYVTMNDTSWGSWSWDRWDWLINGSSAWHPEKEPVCWPDFSSATPLKDMPAKENQHYYETLSGTNKYVLDFKGIHKAAIAGINSTQYAPFFTIAAAGESQFIDYSSNGASGLGASIDDRNGIWQMTGLATINGNDNNGLGSNHNYVDIICKAPISSCYQLPDALQKTCIKAANGSQWTTYFASLKNPCCCAKLAKFWMDNNDPNVGQSCFSTNSNTIPSWGGNSMCQINAPLQVPWSENNGKQGPMGKGTMDAYQQGTGQMESAYNTNFLGPICHLSGTKSGGSIFIPPPSPPTPPPTPCPSDRPQGKCTYFSYDTDGQPYCKNSTDISCTTGSDTTYPKCSKVAPCSDYQSHKGSNLCCSPN